MGNTASTTKITPKDRAILDLKNQRDSLQKYQKRILVLTDHETEIAKECLRQGQKSKALLALRRKKYQESLLARADLQLEQLQRLASDIEFAAIQKDVLYGLQQGTVALKLINEEMGGMARVEKLLEENEEARAYEREVSELLGGKLSTGDEVQVEEELLSLEAETIGISGGNIETLPNAPSTKLPKGKEVLPNLQGETGRAPAQRESRLEEAMAA